MPRRERDRPIRCALIAAVAAAVSAFASAETLTLDLTAWQADVVQTDGWTLTGIGKYAADTLGGAAYFNGSGDTISSPTVSRTIRSVRVESATTSGSLTRDLRLVPIVGGVLRDDAAIALERPTGSDFVSQTLDIADLDATCVYLTATTGNGNWAVRRIVVTYGEASADPADDSQPTVKGVDAVTVREAPPDGFSLSWPAVEGASGYVVNVWTNGLVGASAGTEVLGERFANVTGRTFKAEWTLNELNEAGDYGHWSGELVRGYEGGEARGVVLGTESYLGWLMSDPIDASGDLVVRLRLTRHTEKDSAPVLVAFVSGGVTNFSDTVTLATDIHSFNDYVVTATNVPAGSRFLLSSQRRPSGASCGRVAVGEIAVVAGACAGTQVEIPLVLDRATDGCSFEVGGAEAVTYGYSVAARFVVEGTNALSAAVAGEIDMANPPWLDCWRVAEFPASGVRELDLSGFGRVSKQFDWENGRASGGLYAYANGTAVGKCRPYSASAVYGGVYCYEAGTSAASTNGVALLASGSTELTLCLPVRLDSERKLASFALSFAVRRLNEGTAPTELVCEWSVFDDFGAMTEAATVWHPAATHVAGEADGRYTIDVPRAAVRSGRYCCFRWRVAAQANSAMVGLSDVRVRATHRADGLAIVIR